jgi:hypothetical protein
LITAAGVVEIMSQDSESSREQSTKPIRRFGTGTLSLLQVLCFTLLFIAVNYLGALHYKPKDLSAEAIYSLSPATQRYLESPIIRNRIDPVKMLVAFRRTNPMYEKVRALAEEYRRISNGKVKLEVMDPVRSPDRTQQVVDEYGKVFGRAFGKSIFTTDLVIVDAQTQEEKTRQQKEGEDRLFSPHVRFVEAETMVRFETDSQKGQRKVTGFLGEDALTTGLVAAIEGKPRQIYLLADKCGFSADGEGSPLANFESSLLTQNALTTRVRISELSRIPENAAAVAIIHPVYDLTAAELEVLTEYWSRPRSALLITLGTAETPPRLRAFLRNHGITPGKDRVITKKGSQVISTARGDFTEGMAFTKDFWGKTASYEGSTCSLEIRDRDNEDLIERRIIPYTLLTTGPEFWGETAFSTAEPFFDPREDTPGPISLVGAVIRGAATSDEIGENISRLVVIGNSDFLQQKNYSNINKDFLTSSLNWLIGRPELAGTGPRTLGTYKLPLLDSQLSFINRINLFFLPALIFLTGIIVWSARRA